MAKPHRRQKGITIVEMVAAITLMLPTILSLMYAMLEANQFFTIRTKMDLAARRAAQVLLSNYYVNGTQTNISSPGPLTNAGVPAAQAFDIPAAGSNYFVNHSANQFIVTWNSTSQPTTVTVTAIYPTGGDPANSIPRFPFPDPLNLRNYLGTGIEATATFAAAGQ